uniref:Uncharacterized protein n=1 Tax=Tanacetum cinerariifolium TaxID=118510 RepID=A0A6L2NN28_TANCI|nr:hypothetical protein [Tanacetum cinerariifolium]
MINEKLWQMSQYSLVSESNVKGYQFLFRWRYNEFFSFISWENIEILEEHLNIKLTLLVCHLKIIEIGLLDLGHCEPELLHVDFWHISRGKEGLVESSVFDDVKEDLKMVEATSKFQNLLNIGMLVWDEADSETFAKKESMKKAFQDMLHELGEVNPTHVYYNGSRTSKDNEDTSWSTSLKTKRTQKTSSALEML